MPYLSQNLKPLRILKGFKLLWNSFFIAVIIAVIFSRKKFWIEAVNDAILFIFKLANNIAIGIQSNRNIRMP